MAGKNARLIRRRSVYEGYCFRVVSDTVIWPNQLRLERSLILHPGISVMVPVVDKKHIILIRQYRYGAKSYLWEVPAGTIAPPESALTCAKRELQEEIGYKAGRWKALGACFTSPGYNTERIHCFAAYELERTRTRLEKDELIEPQVVSHERVKAMLQNGNLIDAKSFIALSYFFRFQNRLKK